MNDMVQSLGQELLAAAWDTARLVDDAEGQARRLDDLLEWVAETQAQLAGLRMRLIHEAKLAGADAVVDRVRSSTRTTTQRAAADLRLASDLADGFPLIDHAVCEGEISMAQAEGMISGLKQLPARLTRQDLERCQARLLAEADSLGPYELRVLAARMVELIDPEAAEEAEAVRLAREERRARRGRQLRITPDFHGSMRIIGQLPLADGALLQAQIEALLPPASSYASDDEMPTMEARRADALVSLTQLAASSGQMPEHGLDRPHVHVTVGLETLTNGLGRVGLLGSSEHQQLSAGEARRLACDADLIPVVLGGHSQPLDVGRTHRLVPKALRMALTHRDQGCSFPHCSVAAPACEAHHIQPWWAGGETSIANTVLLCARHHRLVEPDPNQSRESQWQARIDTGTGLPMFIPPRHIDPARKPRQHRRHLLQTMKLAPDGSAATSAPERRAPLCPASEPPPTPTSLPQPAPKDDPWHPDYQPRPKAPPRPLPDAWLASLPLPEPKDDPWHPDYQAPDSRQNTPALGSR